MEARISITIEEYGRDEANLERVLDAFVAAAPETGPVVSANTVSGTLTVTFALDAPDFDELKAKAVKTFGDGMAASGLLPTDVVDVDIEAVSAAAELHRELQPA